MSEKQVQLTFTEEEVAKLQASAEAHKMTLEEFVKKMVQRSMAKSAH